MASKYHILIDATPESSAPFFRDDPRFQSWLRSHDNIPDALEFITQIQEPYSIEIYLARNSILDDGLPQNPNGPVRTLIQTFCDLQTIKHITIYSPGITAGLEYQIRAIMTDKRLLKKVIAVINLHANMCFEGMSYFDEEIARCIATKDIHLVGNFQENRDALMKYLKKLKVDRQRILENLIEQHSNKSSEQES